MFDQSPERHLIGWQGNGAGRWAGPEAAQVCLWKRPERGEASRTGGAFLLRHTSSSTWPGRHQRGDRCSVRRVWVETFGHPATVTVQLALRVFSDGGGEWTDPRAGPAGSRDCCWSTWRSRNPVSAPNALWVWVSSRVNHHPPTQRLEPVVAAPAWAPPSGSKSLVKGLVVSRDPTSRLFRSQQVGLFPKGIMGKKNTSFCCPGSKTFVLMFHRNPDVKPERLNVPGWART